MSCFIINHNFCLDCSCEKENGVEEDSEKEEVIEKGEVEATKEKEKKDDQEVVFIQDMGFTVKIISPGTEPFDMQVILFFLKLRWVTGILFQSYLTASILRAKTR